MENIYTHYYTWKLDTYTWILGTGNNELFAYLLEGKDKALLLDTGWGTLSLRAIVEGLTDKPIIVANTHCHVDHVGGNAEWDEVFMSEDYEYELNALKPNPFQLPEYANKNYRIKTLKDGDTIDLGERILDVIVSKGHAESGLVFYDRNTGYLLTGDDVMTGHVMFTQHGEINYPPIPRIRQHNETMKRLLDMKEKISYLLPCHFATPISPDYIDAYYKLGQEILNGDYKDDEPLGDPMLESHPNVANFRRVNGHGVSFIYEL